jgi:hypothetical protein
MIGRRAAIYFAIGCVIYALAVVVMAPAPWVGQVLEQAAAHALLLREPAGTVWSGGGRLYLRKRSGPPVELGPLRWSTSLSPILSGKLATSITLSDLVRPVHLELSPAGMTIRNLNLEVPATVLAAFAPALEAMDPDGKLRLRSDRLQVAAGSILGLADIEWRQVGLAPLPGISLGSHIARLRGAGSKVEIELDTIEGPLRLRGGGTWTAGGGLALSGTIEHGADSSAKLVPFLRGMCSEYRDGRCGFRLPPRSP